MRQKTKRIGARIRDHNQSNHRNEQSGSPKPSAHPPPYTCHFSPLPIVDAFPLWARTSDSLNAHETDKTQRHDEIDQGLSA